MIPVVGPLRLLGRSGCHLCEQFLEEFLAAFPSIVVLSEDVDSRVEWRSRYGKSIPVLIDAGGSVVCETFFDKQTVTRALGAL